jgi:signal transduction histidine kinase
MMKHKQLSMMKTDFINNMAHELKTPLTTIAVASSTLAEHSVQADVKKVNELSGLIKQQNNHLGRLIDQILDINIWERDRIALQKSEVYLKSFFEKILKGFELENDGKDFNLIKMIQFGDESMELDGFKFSLAVRNLLSNALKYGGKIPEVELKAGMSGGEVKIEISDNGSGITKEEQKHIFDKFYRGQNSKQGIKGLGLGLYYVKKIVEMHGGMIGIKNSNNKGTTFIVTVPYENHVVKI